MSFSGLWTESTAFQAPHTVFRRESCRPSAEVEEEGLQEREIKRTDRLNIYKLYNIYIVLLLLGLLLIITMKMVVRCQYCY